MCMLPQTLAFLDLHQLSLHCPQRRREAFSLSVREQPEVWESVCSQCLGQVVAITRAFSSNKDSSQAGVGGRDSGGSEDQQLLADLPPAPGKDGTTVSGQSVMVCSASYLRDDDSLTTLLLQLLSLSTSVTPVFGSDVLVLV